MDLGISCAGLNYGVMEVGKNNRGTKIGRNATAISGRKWSRNCSSYCCSAVLAKRNALICYVSTF